MALWPNLQSVKKRDQPSSEDRSRPTFLLDAASRSDEHLTDVTSVDPIAHGVPPWNLTTGEEFDPTLGTIKFLDPVMDLLGFFGMPTDWGDDDLPHVPPHPGQSPCVSLGKIRHQQTSTGVLPAKPTPLSNHSS